MSRFSHRMLILVMALASLGATAFITANVIQRYRDRDEAPLTVMPPADDAPIAGHGGGAPALSERELAPIKTLPDFVLTERSGRPRTSADLRGKVWIADFVFTRCGDTCPMMTQQMAKLQARLAADPRRERVRLVSFSVDPNFDTPAVLRDYAEAYDADPALWLFATGDRDAIWSLANEGFMLGVGQSPNPNPRMPIFHSSRFALVDREGRLRGFYEGLEAAEQERLVRDVQRLLDE